MGIVTSVCTYAYVQVFKRIGFMCSSDFIVKATPPLFIALLLYRIFGPEDQGVSIGHSEVPHIDRPDRVNSSTYAGGGGLPDDSECWEQAEETDEEIFKRMLNKKIN